MPVRESGRSQWGGKGYCILVPLSFKEFLKGVLQPETITMGAAVNIIKVAAEK